MFKLWAQLSSVSAFVLRDANGTIAACFATFVIAAHAPAWGEDKVAPKDRTALATCLDQAKAGKKTAEGCIGTVQKPCIESPDGGTTMGMKECTGREIAVWDERLNQAYRAALAGDLGKQQTVRDGDKRKLTGADILRDAQRAWVAFRDKKCDAAGLPMEGGTGAGLLSGDCYLQETARQALWLEDMSGEK
jgi:uncharacterized protein YecT (DUF1311 family)